MKVLMMTDLEGAAGVVSFETQTYSAGPENRRACSLLTAEVNVRYVWDVVQDIKVGESGYAYVVSDSGILQEWCRRELGRNATTPETSQIRQRFLQFLQSAPDKHFKPLAGVESWLQKVEGSPGIFAAIATGGWRHSARHKLKESGLDRFKLALASSDDAIERTKIMQIAAEKLIKSQRLEHAIISYVGDGVWDLQASQALNWNFIGIASGDQAQRLKKAGAANIYTDFTQP